MSGPVQADTAADGSPRRSITMRRFLFVLVGGLLIGSAAMATTTCPNGTYNLYQPSPPGVGPSITCATNNLGFSQFGFTSSASGALLPTPASLGVTVIDSPGNHGFNFNPGFTEGPGQSQDVALSFEVSALNGATITDLSIFFNGAIFGTGSTSFSETYCTTSFTMGCSVFQVNNPPPNLFKDISIAPTTTLFITKDFVASGGVLGSASISKVE